MDFFKRIFGKRNPEKQARPAAEQRGKFMPEIKLPTDEKFTINFKKNGGKFLYCDSMPEVLDCFKNILEENSWEASEVCCTQSELKKKFAAFKLPSELKCQHANVLLTRCENLVADNGAILISSNQIGESKLHELPDNFVVFATTSQLIDTIGEGLRGIKTKNRQQIPTNITTIKHFEIGQENDFMSYGSSAKNLYLLLLEDL